MAERDAFEVRFGAAVQDYAGRVWSDLDPVELAHRIAASEPRRHWFAAAVAWRGVAIPRRAWVLLLLAALLTALVAGMLVAGSQLQRKLPAVVPPVGQVFECPPGSTPDEPGPVGQARPSHIDHVVALDLRMGRMVILGGIETWTFDVCSNTWTQMHPDRHPSVGAGNRYVYDVDSELTVAVAPDGRIWSYDLAADTWTEKGVAPMAQLASLVYDPVSGRVIAAGATSNGVSSSMKLWSYDVDIDTWTPIHQQNGPSYGAFAYDASIDRMVVYTRDGDLGPKTWLFDIRTGRWSMSDTVTPAVPRWMTDPAIVYDEAAKRTVAIGNYRLAAYDATADRWDVLIELDRSRPRELPTAMVYDPVNGRLVGPADPEVSAVQGDVVAFDLATREWTVLLEPSGR